MQTQDEILATLNTLALSLGLSDYCVLGIALVNCVKTGELSYQDIQKVGIMVAGEITGDREFAANEAEKYGRLIDEHELRQELFQFNEAQLMALRKLVTISQQVLPVMFKQGMKSFLRDLPPLQAGRHERLNEMQKREACERILDLVRQKVKRGDAIKRVALALDASVATINRAWAERDNLLAKPNDASSPAAHSSDSVAQQTKPTVATKEKAPSRKV